MKLISWNVNGLRACMGKGFLDFVAAEQPDMLCLQETKMQPGQADVPLEGVYSWWSYRFHAREKNAGWRIDYFLVSDRFVERVKDARILTDVFGSDHCPVLIEIE